MLPLTIDLRLERAGSEDRCASVEELIEDPIGVSRRYVDIDNAHVRRAALSSSAGMAFQASGPSIGTAIRTTPAKILP